ncbi:hypothetical protein SAMN04488105_1309 [Salipiger thiooxidans]|uniref:Uncharacterized protein n=1 Tax=Salipiger thiooxidans TaxID=282683 RepID=A0A1G7M675_9RHOB|nr:hypothetical protein [Salipiger thiooxidans]SDF57175.1 hypothetical protein SAMN04488105_1309 [Salipiger thiooxidans]
MRQLIALAASAALTVFTAARTPAQTATAAANSYTVRAAILARDNCNVSLDVSRFVAFERAVCLYHQAVPEDGRSLDELAAVQDLLAEAQILGLPPAQQQFAALLSGLAYAHEAVLHQGRLDALDPDAGEAPRLVAESAVCRARRIALAELGAVDWRFALIDYEATTPVDPNLSLAARLEEMTGFYAPGAVLNGEAHDVACGQLAPVAPTRRDAIADEAVKATVDQYFGGSRSRAAAMFARKLEQAVLVRESSARRIEELKHDAQEVTRRYEALNAQYRREVQRYDEIAERYESASVTANQVLDEYERWRARLYISPTDGADLLPLFEEGRDMLSAELRAMSDASERPNRVKRADTLLVNIEKAINRTALQERQLEKMCRIYACQLLTQRSLPDLVEACARPPMKDNPLCVNKDRTLRGGADAVELCSGVHVVKEILKASQPFATAEQAAQCWADARGTP